MEIFGWKFADPAERVAKTNVNTTQGGLRR